MPHHRLVSLSVTNGRHFPSAELTFADGLNCIVGGRGAGKTSILQYLEFALGGPASSQLERTLGTGRVSLRVRTQHGAEYTSRRSLGDRAPVVTDAAGDVVSVSLDGELFKLLAYSQNGIETIAEAPGMQLKLVDGFAAPELAAASESIAQTEARLARNASALTQAEESLADHEARAGELASVEAVLAALVTSGGPDAGEARRAHEAKVARGREKTSLAALDAQLAAIDAALDALGADARGRLAGAIDVDLARGASPNAPVIARAHAAVTAFGALLPDLVARIRRELDAARVAAQREARALDALHAEQNEAYRELQRRHAEDEGKIAERERLQARLVSLRAAAAQRDELRRRRDELRRERKALLAERTRLRESRFAIRERVARELTASLRGEVRVSITHAGDFEEYARLLAELLRGANVRPAEFVRDIARNIRPEDLVAQAVADDPRAIVAIDESKTGKAERAQRVLSALRASGRLHELETVPVDDVPLIELRVGNAFQPSSKVSTGQRCTAILPILLLRSTAPLLIDQPEDNLDNAFIYDVLVKSIAVAKKERQLVFVTHNPNIPVLGDAERVFVLEADGDSGRVAQVGTVDEVRGTLERLLEGGKEAFLRRGERYGHHR